MLMIAAVHEALDDADDEPELGGEAPLEPAEIAAGRRGELARLEHFGVKEEIDEAEAVG